MLRCVKCVALVAPQGIFKPKLLPQMPLSITTTPESDYDDSFDNDGLLLYRYRRKGVSLDIGHGNAGRPSKFQYVFRKRYGGVHKTIT